MESFRYLFTHFPAYLIVICKECGRGITQGQLRKHLEASHQGLTPSTRRAMVQAAQDVPDWARHAHEVVFPAPTDALLPYLPVWHDGLRCQDYRGVYRGLQNMQTHCRKAHRWTNQRKRGRPSCGQRREAAIMWETGVSCQKFNYNGELARLFQVEAAELAGRPPLQEEDPIQQAMEASFRQTVTALEAAQQTAHELIRPDENRFEANPWLNRVGWAKHLAGLDRS